MSATRSSSTGTASPAGLSIMQLTAAETTRLPTWTLPATAVLFAASMIGTTRLALWYQNKRPRSHDLSQLEGDPTARADVLIDDDQQVHGLEIKTAQQPLVAVTCTSSPRSLPGLGMALLMLAAAALAPAAAFFGLARLIPASGGQTIAAAVLAFVTTAACGIVMMIRIEQLQPGTVPLPRPGPGDGHASGGPDPGPPSPSE